MIKNQTFLLLMLQYYKRPSYRTRTGLNGSYFIKNVADGKYTVSVTYTGYAIQEQQIEVSSNAVLTLDFNVKESSANMQEIVVTAGRNRESDRSTRLTEKNAGNIVNILSAQAIQVSPDITVASVLQRMSGVTIERSASGEGRYAIIRGMDQRYNNTLVNGIKIPSPDDKYRYVPMDIFPSELLESLEVNKSLPPSMEGDAIGGTMNMIMKNAPDKLHVQVNVSGGYNTLFSGRSYSRFSHSVINKRSPGEIHGTDYQATGNDFTKANLDFTPKSNPINSTIGFSAGNRFFRKRLGVVLASSYQDIFRGSNSDFFIQMRSPIRVTCRYLMMFSSGSIQRKTNGWAYTTKLIMPSMTAIKFPFTICTCTWMSCKAGTPSIHLSPFNGRGRDRAT